MFQHHATPAAIARDEDRRSWLRFRDHGRRQQRRRERVVSVATALALAGASGAFVLGIVAVATTAIFAR